MPRRRKRHGSYPSLTVIFSITTALFVIGLFGTMLLHAGRLSQLVRGSIRLQVFLDRDLAEDDRTALRMKIGTRPFVAQRRREAQIEFISKEAAAQQMIDETGQDFTELLGNNPLRDAFEVAVAADWASAEQLRQVRGELEAMDGVYEVFYVESVVTAINRNITQISLILLALAAVLIVTVVVLINNTVKLALFSQRFLIRSMQLVGATANFIRRPFLWRAAWQGVLSGAIAALLLWGVLAWAYARIPDLEVLRNTNSFLVLVAILLFLGGSIGLVSAFAAIRRYLGLSLDELY
ncbi:MAG: permease-like cell division protein FtsX [Catalinimonas sp.]